MARHLRHLRTLLLYAQPSGRLRLGEDGLVGPQEGQPSAQDSLVRLVMPGGRLAGIG